MLNCLIVDDEPLARTQIECYVAQVPFLRLVGTARNPVVAQAILQTEPVDLIFLNIKMPQMSGIELLRKHEIFQQVILITAYPEFAVQGFELEVTDYLMKPVTLERFQKACDKALAKVSGSSAVRILLEQPDFLYVKCNQRFEKILFSDILFVESMLNYVHIITVEKEYTVYSSMKAIQEQLPQELFIRIHKSYLVAISHVKVVRLRQLEVAGYFLPVSRNHQADVQRLVTGFTMKKPQ